MVANGLGSPNLYEVENTAVCGGQASIPGKKRIGLRTITIQAGKRMPMEKAFAVRKSTGSRSLPWAPIIFLRIIFAGGSGRNAPGSCWKAVLCG